jgi:hypothetical protein
MEGSNLKTSFKWLVSQLLERTGFQVVKVEASKSKSDKIDLQVKFIQMNYRLLARVQLYNRVSHLDGAIVEAGVGGGSGIATFALLEDSNKLRRKIWGFDSFSGFPSGTNEDSLEFLKYGKPEYKEFSKDFVMHVLRSIMLSVETLNNIRLCEGYMPQSFGKYNREPIALLHVDVDLYQSTKDVLEYFWPYLQSKGIVILDEYDCNDDAVKWPGAKKAIDDFCNLNKVTIQRTIGNRPFLVKP